MAKSAVIAIIASLLVISLYIALRFEWKYAVPVLIALMHDLLITAGVYSLLGREVTTSTVAALLTILGYSLYDTIIVFDRVRENVPRMPRAAFSQIVNRSMSEVLTRSLATSFCTALPIAALLFFGGDTLKDFAFALLVGVISGTYSSIFIASPVLTHWKERESVYVRRRRRIAEDNGGVVPAYAVAAGGAPVDVAPQEKERAQRRLTQPDDPQRGVSQDEFQEMVRDLHVEAPPTATAERDPTADLDPEDLVLKDDKPKRAQAQAAAQPPPQEEPLAMAMLAWIMMGLAIWHFTIFIPDRFWGGIVGAFLGALIGAVLFGLIVNGFTIPGQHDTHICTALEAIPGALIGIALVYFEGIRRGRRARALTGERDDSHLGGRGPDRAGVARDRRGDIARPAPLAREGQGLRLGAPASPLRSRGPRRAAPDGRGSAATLSGRRFRSAPRVGVRRRADVLVVHEGGHELAAATNAGLVKDRGQVLLHRVGRDLQFRRDLLCRASAAGQARDLTLARRQAVGQHEHRGQLGRRGLLDDDRDDVARDAR